MFNSNKFKIAIAFFAIVAMAFGSASIVSAAEVTSTSTTVSSGDTVVVDASGNQSSFTTIQGAVDHVANTSATNVTISIYPDTYNESVLVKNGGMTFENADSANGTVKIDSTDTAYTKSVRLDNEDYQFTLGSDVTLVEATSGGSGTSSGSIGLSDTYYGIPVWGYAVGLGAVVFLYYREEM
jgi:pectin methylesterase-like acyl-CoA thioesterase